MILLRRIRLENRELEKKKFTNKKLTEKQWSFLSIQNYSSDFFSSKYVTSSSSFLCIFLNNIGSDEKRRNKETECVTDFDKLNLVCNGGLNLRFQPILPAATAASKYVACLKSGQKRLKKESSCFVSLNPRHTRKNLES